MIPNLNTLTDLDRWLTLGASNRYWYQETHDDIQRILPHERVELIIDLLAATSIRSSISSNVFQMFRALIQYKLGEPFNGFLPAVKTGLELVRNGAELPTIKVRHFARAMKGDESAVVVDVWMCQAFGIKGSGGPKEDEYRAIVKAVQQLAHERDVTPREFQAMLWAGIRKERSKYQMEIRYKDLMIKYKPWYDTSLKMLTPEIRPISDDVPPAGTSTPANC